MRERTRFRVARDGEVVAEGTASECARATGLEAQTVRTYAYNPGRSRRWSVSVVAPDSAYRVAVDMLLEIAGNGGRMGAKSHRGYVKRIAALRK